MPPLHWRASALGATLLAANLLVAPLVVQAQSAASSPAVHVVQDGETLGQIALDAGTDAATVASLNGLDDANTLSIGQTLKLPSRSAAAAPAAAAPAAAATPAVTATYTVTDGDTLWDIAQRLGTATDALAQLNQLDDADRLSLGMVLHVPAGHAPAAHNAAKPGPSAPAAAAPAAAPAATAAATSTSSTGASAPASAVAEATSKRNLLVSYTVQPGETLSQIAKQFDVRSDAIAQATNLADPNKLAVGAVLQVPVPAREHVVSAGETLRDIAANEKVDLGSLIDFNQLDDPELIHVGQVVLLPQAANQQAATVASSTVAGPEAPAAPRSQAAPSGPGASSAQAAPPGAGTTSGAASSGQAASASSAATAPTVKVTAAATPSPTQTAAVAPAAPVPPAPKPVGPVAVVAAPAGAPTDGMVGAGLKLLGSAYVWGGSSPTSGFDCSGFVWYVAKQAGKQLSRGMFGQYNSGSHPGRDQLQIGDLVFFQNTFSPGLSHNGIYIGNGQFVHAADEAAGVTISSLNTAYWSSHWFGATRLP